MNQENQLFQSNEEFNEEIERARNCIDGSKLSDLFRDVQANPLAAMIALNEFVGVIAFNMLKQLRPEASTEVVLAASRDLAINNVGIVFEGKAIREMVENSGGAQ